ncbi:hypothetical protein [Mesonia aestuariivivens]|uniref:Uncharacterized protein n=1 Tax=Mesonia aestuariivivens TaxID=2796128 RepID=A0ABS6W590_9FLAO|nr:hypothetical protein [Mesonia aestuariivivens]MBW2962279.1 hypothetical protein [Mesonia aestuariivivens]
MYKKQVNHQKAFDRARELKAEKAAYRAGNIFMVCIAIIAITLLCIAIRNTTLEKENIVSHHIFNEP